MKKERKVRTDGDLTRARLKKAAQRLFALKGIHGASIKDIIDLADQKNKASLQYHFGSKEALIAELVLDGAKTIDARRKQLLLKIEDELSVRKILEALIYPVNEIVESDPEGSTYIRFVSDLQMNHRILLREILGNKWNSGYRRCLELIKELSPGIHSAVLEQRLSMVGIYSNAIFAAKEASFDSSKTTNRFWLPPFTIENIIDSLEFILIGTPSSQTQKLISNTRS